jgi:diguanylate cyclase (GGDEF)-like protein/PAS domain S-box-containing protein
LAADRGAHFWRAEATMRLERSTRREESMREQYEIGIQLLDHERADPKRLGWLATTDVRGACLAVWDGDPSDGRVRIAGVYDPDAALPDLIGTICTVEQFPPASLIGRADPRADESTIVVPVKARGLDFGLLAVAGRVDVFSANGRETHNQWAALLTAALEQQNLLETVQTSEERYSLWAVATNDGLWDWDLTTDTIYYSGRCMELLGHDDRGVSAGSALWLDAVHSDDAERVRELLRAAATGPLVPVAFECRVRGAGGLYRFLSCRAMPVGSVAGPVARIVGSMHDSDHRKQLETRLRRSALYDEVTGLPNRKLFLDRLDSAITQARESSERRYAVVFLDLDGFKLVNDSLGHLVGDQLLTQIGQRLRSGLRPSDLAARFGGDEFAVLLHDIAPNAIRPIVERMQASLAAPMELDGQEVAVTASVGIATSAGDYTNAEDVLRDADIAMYHAKSHNRGSFAMFDVGMHAAAVARLALRSELAQAFERKQFEVRYQPIVRLDAHRTDHFEALVRWHHPQRGLVPPMDFLPDMQETGLIVTLGRWIIDEVCRQIAQWERSYDGTVNVSVNVSHREFSDAGLLPHIHDCLRRYGLTASNLTLEITESVIMRAPEAARAIIDELHEAGIGVQIDDFGTGASLHALHRYGLQALKIDRSLTGELDVDPRTTRLVEIIIAMGHALGVDVVAEGVETAGQLEALRGMGCRIAQGFFFTEAVEGAAATKLLGQTLPLLGD